MHKENNDNLHEDVKIIISSVGDKSHDPKKTLCEGILYAAEDGWLYHDDILEEIIIHLELVNYVTQGIILFSIP